MDDLDGMLLIQCLQWGFLGFVALEMLRDLLGRQYVTAMIWGTAFFGGYAFRLIP